MWPVEIDDDDQDRSEDEREEDHRRCISFSVGATGSPHQQEAQNRGEKQAVGLLVDDDADGERRVLGWDGSARLRYLVGDGTGRCRRPTVCG